MDAPAHIPVLLGEVLDLLSPAPGETLVDCTAGLGGHAAAMAAGLVPGGRVVLNDVDPANLARASARVRGAAPGVEVVEIAGNFAGIAESLRQRGIVADAVLADLGFSSNQMDDQNRGLSFRGDGPLDMRLDPTLPESAADLVATLPEEELARVLWEFGEEKRSRAVARKIVAVRAREPITTTTRLAELVRSVVARSHGPRSIDPATRTFQALRIAVNDELGVLAGLLDAVGREADRLSSGIAGGSGAAGWLGRGARVGVISFHSLEDRAVKRAFASLRERGVAEAVTRKPVEAGEAEVSENPRARSAKLRVVRVG